MLRCVLTCFLVVQDYLDEKNNKYNKQFNTTRRSVEKKSDIFLGITVYV